MDRSDTPLQRLLDIEPPPMPPEAAWDTIALAASIGVLLMLGVVLLWRWYRSPRTRARLELGALSRAHARNQIDSRTAAFWTAALLRQGFRANRLPAVPPSAQTDEQHIESWRRFLRRLEQQRFAPTPTDRDELAILLGEARDWLRKLP